MGKVLVTMKGCSSCPYVKNKLKEKNIKFKSVDIESKEGKKLDKKHHFVAMPSMVIDGKKVENVKKWFE